MSLFFDKRIFPFLEEEDITSLEEKGIENPADFLRASVSKIDKSCNLTITQIKFMREYFLKSYVFEEPSKFIRKREKIECCEIGINDYLGGGFTPGEIVLFSSHAGEHDLMTDFLSDMAEEFSDRFAICVGEYQNSGQFLPKRDEHLLNVNVYSLGTYADCLRFLNVLQRDVRNKITLWHFNLKVLFLLGVENLFYPCQSFSVNKDAPVSFMHHLKKLAKETNLVIILNLQKTGTSKEVYRTIWQKCDKEIYAEKLYDPWISLYEGKTAANHEISLHLKLREKDEDVI